MTSYYERVWAAHKAQHTRTGVRKHSFDAAWHARDQEVEEIRHRASEQVAQAQFDAEASIAAVQANAAAAVERATEQAEVAIERIRDTAAQEARDHESDRQRAEVIKMNKQLAKIWKGKTA